MDNLAAHKKRLVLVTVCSVAFLGVVVAVAVIATKDDTGEQEPVSSEQHAQQILERMPIIDGHNDFPWSLRNLVFNDLRKVNVNSDLRLEPAWANYAESATDIPRLKQGKVGAQFWVAYTSCASEYKDSVEQTLEQIDVIKRFAANYSDHLMFATSVADIEKAIEEKKIASLVAVEGGHSIQSSFGILRLMYELGVRYMTLTHNCNTPWADTALVDRPENPLDPVNDGLNEFGLQVVDEMNRLGMMVDLSHVSVATMKKAILRSKAPVIFSHSSAKAICNHQRNVPDDVLELVALKNSIVMVNFYPGFVQCNSSKNATLQDVVTHIEHIRNVTGSADFVGIGGDFDGIDSRPEGLEDVSKYPDLFQALIETGRWSDLDLEKLSGRNILRVFRDVELVRDSLLNSSPQQDVIKKSDIENAKGNTSCITAKFIDAKSEEKDVTRRKRESPEF